MVKKIGIILPYLHDSQMAYECIKESNYLCATDNEYDVSIFYEDITPNIIKPICGVFNASELFSYDGDIISTTLDNSKYLINAIKPKRKIFYIYELEWLKNQKNYLENIKVYQSSELELVTVSKEYAREIYNYCGRVPNIVKRFRIKDIICQTKSV